ncbi:MAG: hypothetical protein ACM31N_00525 [Deltaproteobacteria bacterium]
MKRLTMVILLALLVLVVLSLAGGCSTATQASRPDNPPGVAVRLPAIESPDVSLRAEESGRWRPPLEPQSVGDEYSGRWLRLIEIDIYQPDVAGPPDAEPEKQ